MLRQIEPVRGDAFPHSPALRGLRSLYRRDEVNHCPACGRSHWVVGRFSAQCAFCATALPLADTDMLGVGTYWRGASRSAEGEWHVS